MRPVNCKQPTLEAMEPRLLMSGSPALEDLFASAIPLSVTADGTVSENGTLVDDHGSVMYKFTTPAAGRVYVGMEALGDGLDPYLQLFNANQQLIGANNNSARDTLDSLIRRFVQPGSTYYVLACGNQDTTGDYELAVTSDPIDDFGGSLVDARALRTRRNGAGGVWGRINYSGDEDYLAFAAVQTGLARVRLDFCGRNNTLEGALAAYDDGGALLGSVVRDGEDSLYLEFSVEEGRTYHLRASGQNGTQGRYRMRMASVFAQEFVDAEEVVLAGEDEQAVAGTLAADGSYTYQFTAVADGYFHLDMRAADGSEIDPYLEVFNANQQRVARNDNLNRNVADSHIRLRVRAGQTYYVRASAAEGTAGDYELTLTSDPRDDHANDAALAASMRVRWDGASAARGTINYTGDVDYLEYTAPASGLVQVQLYAYGRSNELCAALAVYDDAGGLVASQSADGQSSLELSFTAIEGETYYYAVSGEADTTGRYLLRVAPTVLQEFIDAEEVLVPSLGTESVTGSLDADGSTCHRFTAQADGYVYVDMAAANDSGLDAYVEVFNDAQRRIAANDNYGSRTDSRVRFSVRAGQTYYVRTSAVRGTGGDYQADFTSVPLDDAGNDIDTAKSLPMNNDGSARAAGNINYSDDVDVLKIVAAVTGEMTVAMAPYGDAALTPKLWATDAVGQQLAIDENGDAVTAVTFDATAGQTYYLFAASLEDGTGRYVLGMQTVPTVVPEPDPVPDPDPEPDPDPVPPPDAPTPGANVTGYTVNDGGVVRLVVAGTDGSDAITLSLSGTTMTLTGSAGTQTFTGTIDSVWIYGFAGNDVIRTDWSLTVTSVIYAGDGNDSVYDNGQAAATIYGGLGDDLLVSVGGGRDSLYGEGGTDSFWLDGSDALRDATSAEINATNVHRIQQFYQPYTTNPAQAGYVALNAKGEDLIDPTPTSYGRAWVDFSNRPLFVDGPQYDDIIQGYVGDCYYLASLASLADTDPNLMRQMITDLGDGTYAVRFYRDNQEVYLRLDGDLPVTGGTSLAYARLTPDGETWVALAEKAYAYFRYGQNSYASISGGWMSTVYRELTNQSTSTVWVGGSQATLATTITNALAAGHAITLGSNGAPPSPIVGSHAYMIKSIEGSGSSAIVTVFNPWGVDGRSYDANYNDGLLRLSMTQMQESFTAMVICNA